MKSEFMTASIDPGKVSDLLRECARKHILPYHGKLLDHHKSFKGGNPHNEVTVADRESEEFLTRELRKLIPDSVVVGEEATEEDKRIPDLLKDPANVVWVIDPIDGTSNFARGSDTFCVMVALVEGGETRMSWIYDVTKDSMAFAEKGKGAFVDGRKIGIDPNNPAEQGFAGYRILDKVTNITINTLRCAGHEYLRVAKGEAAFAIYSFMKPWDHLAGVLLVQEAGGHTGRWDGAPYKPGDTKGGIIAAATAQIWQKVRGMIPDKSLQKQGVSP